MNPVDARPAPLGVHRPGATEHHDRHAVDVSVEDRHAGMLQADHVVGDGDHRFVFRLGVTVSHSNGDFFMMAEDHFRHVIAAVVNDGIVNAAKSRARIKSCILDIECFHQIDDDVGAVYDVHRLVFKNPPQVLHEFRLALEPCRHLLPNRRIRIADVTQHAVLARSVRLGMILPAPVDADRKRPFL